MKIILCEVNKIATVTEIKGDLESMQKVVGGWIEPFYFSDEEVAIICNEEGKINGLIPNRAVFDDSGKLVDIIFGDFFICGLGYDDFTSIPDDKIDKYIRRFKHPLPLPKKRS